MVQGEFEHFEEAHEEDGHAFLQFVDLLNDSLEIDRELFDALVDQAVGKVVIAVTTTRHVIIPMLLTKLVVKDGHTAIWKVFQGLEKGLEAVCEALGGGGVHDGLKGLKDLDLLVASLTVAFDRVEYAVLWLTKSVEGDPLSELPLLILQSVLNLLPAFKPCDFFLLILFQKFGSFCLKLLLACLLSW